MDLPISKYGKTERRRFGKIQEVIDIPESKAVSFKATKSLREKLN